MSESILIKNATLFDGTGAPAAPATSILIQDGRVAAVAPTSQLDAAEGATDIDASGKFVIPGLIDMHIHVELCGGREALPIWLGTGVTTIRDVGGSPEGMLPLRDEVEAGKQVGPRIYSYGPLLDGVPSIFGNRPLNGGGPGDLTWVIEDAAKAEAAVDDLLARGVDGFKLYAGLRPDLVKTFIDRIGGRVPVTGHLSRTWASEAIELGINCLEHVYATIYQDVVPPEHRHPREEGNGFIPNYWMWLNTGWAAADLKADYVRQFVELLVSRNVALSPTTVLVTGGMSTRDALEEPGIKYTPKAMNERRQQQMAAMQQMREAAERAGKPLPPVTPPDFEVGRRSLDNQLTFLKMVLDAGGRVVPSTDTGAAPNQVPGFALHRELALFAEAGVPNGRVLELATRVAAEVLRKDDEIGTVTPGKRADLLILGADPLADINNTRTIETVMKDGVQYAPQPLLDTALA
ncbi:MAG: amidohydrolase family protein [Dehalococcoidia bacterium]